MVGRPEDFSHIQEPRKEEGHWKFKVSENVERGKTVRKVTVQRFSGRLSFVAHVLSHPKELGQWRRAFWLDKEVRTWLGEDIQKTKIEKAVGLQKLNQVVGSFTPKIVDIPYRGLAFFHENPALAIPLTLMARYDPKKSEESFLISLAQAFKANSLPDGPKIPRLELSVSEEGREEATLFLPKAYADELMKIDPKLTFSEPDEEGMVQRTFPRRELLDKVSIWGMCEEGKTFSYRDTRWWESMLNAAWDKILS